MSGDRDIRDALAEALRASYFRRRNLVGPHRPGWPVMTDEARRVWRDDADDLLAALPTVSLKIVREA